MKNAYTLVPPPTCDHDVIPHLMRNLITILLLALAFLFSSCDMMFQPVRGYFEEWTSEVSIQKFEVEGVETYYDKDGNLCIPSDHDAQVTFFMINPYHYDYNDPKYSDKIDGLAVLEQQITADPNDTTLLHMTYPSAFLGQHECGGDIGDNIELNHPLNPTKKTFSFKLKCNSRPPEPGTVTIMLSGNGDDATFILCFNLGDRGLFESGKIHSDLKTISINGDVYELNFTSGGAVSVIPKTGGKLSTTRPNGMIANAAGSNSTFSSNLANSLYYSSGISKNNDTTFTIVLTDEAGLKKQSQVSSSAKKLSSPTLHNAQTGAALTSGGDINYIEFINGNIIEIKAPVTTVDGDGVDTSGMVTRYRIERLTTGNQEPKSFTGGNKTVNSNSSDFPNHNVYGAVGEFEVTIWSEKSGYLKSDETVYIVYVKPKLTYTVRHLFQNIDNDNYSPDASYQDQTYTAFKGTTTQAQAYTNVTGFNTPSVSNEELISNNQVVEVRYNRKTYTLSYNTKVNGVTGPSTQSCRHGKVVTVDFTTGTRTGYTLNGWATSNTATSPTYTSTGTNTITMTGDKTLYAVWEKNYYQVNVTYNDCSYTESGTDFSNGKHGYGSVATFVVTPIGTSGLKTAKLTKKEGGGDISNLLSIVELGGTKVSVSFTIPDYEVSLDFACKPAYKVQIEPYNNQTVIDSCKNKAVRIWIVDDNASYDSQYKEVLLDDNAKYDGYICFPDNKTFLANSRIGVMTVNAARNTDHGFAYANANSNPVTLVMSIIQNRCDVNNLKAQLISFRGPSGSEWDHCQHYTMPDNMGFKSVWQIYQGNTLSFESSPVNGITYDINPSNLVVGENSVKGLIKIAGITVYPNTSTTV
ncbi:MAG: InlB B-repeat-containing protein, partial [Treponema sp.]|nr:InlB B-repeat-containing protein [Treponema sp.]